MHKLMLLTMIAAGTVLADDATVDFADKYGKVNPWIHSSSWSSQYASSTVGKQSSIRDLGMKAYRTHDAALVHSGQRIVDTHFIFPLMHLDAKNPSNYYFKATDKYFKFIQEQDGAKIFYRLGTSIEHTTNENAENTLNPKDHDNYAEALAGIVRHYTQGWADGFKWDIEYWELFNEHDIAPCWRGTREESIHLFVTCLKRLKAEFPNIKVGGPGLAHSWAYLAKLLKACKDAGVSPDFVSFHFYGTDVEKFANLPNSIRGVCDQAGFPNMPLIFDEWHYLAENDWGALRGAKPEDFIRTHTGPHGQNGTDSGAFTLAVESRFQDSCLAQAYFYGCGCTWDWGWIDRVTNKPVKPYWTEMAMGELVKNCPDKIRTASKTKGITPFAAMSEDGKTAIVLVADYLSNLESITVGLSNLGDFKLESVRVVDDQRDLEPVPAEVKDGKVVLRKNDKFSSSWILKFVK